MVNEELPLYSARDLSPRYEAFAEDDDEDGNPIFLNHRLYSLIVFPTLASQSFENAN